MKKFTEMSEKEIKKELLSLRSYSFEYNDLQIVNRMFEYVDFIEFALKESEELVQRYQSDLRNV